MNQKQNQAKWNVKCIMSWYVALNLRKENIQNAHTQYATHMQKQKRKTKTKHKK